MRTEKAYRAWGHELSPDDTPLEAGLAFAVDMNKSHFIGRDALLRQREAGVTRRLAAFTLDPDEDWSQGPVPWGDETIFRNGELVGRVSSTAFGYSVGAGGAYVALGYIRHPQVATKGFVQAGDYELNIAGRLVKATASLRAPFDPKGLAVHR